jgi:hypothetical protein
MQKWEYCAIVGMAKHTRNLNPHYPALWYFTSEGCKVSEIKSAETNSVAMTIAKLGDESWEMVGVGAIPDKATVGLDPGVIYFKRLKPDSQ